MAKEQGIRYFPIGLFASVMGFSGVTIAIRQLEILTSWNHTVSIIFLVLTSFLFVINGSILIYRLINHREEVKKDFYHPVKVNFFAAISISLLLLAAAYEPIIENISFILWIVGALLQISLTLIILSKLIWNQSLEIVQFNPTWFIPIVGNIVVPIAGVNHVTSDINWMFFSVGIVFSMIYTTIFIYRVFFHAPIPGKLLPTYFILLAPPAIGFVSYTKLLGSTDVFANILYGMAFFIGLLLLFQLKRFVKAPFTITWWAFLFPSAAMTIATTQMYIENGHSFYMWIFLMQIIGLILLAIYLTGKTIQLMLNHKLCVKE